MKQLLYIGAIGGIIALLISLIQFFYFAPLFDGLLIGAMVVIGIGFVALGMKRKDNILIVLSLILILGQVVEPYLPNPLEFTDLTDEHSVIFQTGSLYLLLMGVVLFFFGRRLLKIKTKVAKWAGWLNIITGLLVASVLFADFGFLLAMPTYLVESWLLFEMA